MDDPIMEVTVETMDLIIVAILRLLQHTTMIIVFGVTVQRIVKIQVTLVTGNKNQRFFNLKNL